MRRSAIFGCLFLAACSSAVTSEPTATGPVAVDAGFAYMLPKGMAHVVVFADTGGIGITLEPARIVKDSRAGELVATVHHSPVHNEDIEFKTTDTPGLLSLVTVNSETQILAIVEEAAKSAARIALQSGKAEFFAQKAVLQVIPFDPLSPDDVARASRAVCEAVSRGRQAFNRKLSVTEAKPTGCDGDQPLIALSVRHTDGTLDDERAFPTAAQLKDACAKGVCARTMTTRLVEVTFNGAILARHAIDLPSRNVVAVPLERSLLANRVNTVTILSGILKENKVEAESELLTLVKLPSRAIGGFFAGLGEQLTAEKDLADKQATALDSQTKVVGAEKNLKKAQIDLHSGTAGGGDTAYASQSTTVYPYLVELTELLKQIKAAAPPGPGGGEGDLLQPPAK